MRITSLVLLCLLVVGCGSTRRKVDEALDSTKELATDVKKTSATLREDTLPAVVDVTRKTGEATEQIRATTLELQRVFVNLEPKIEELKTSLVGTFTELRQLAVDLRELKSEVSLEISHASDIRDKLGTHSRTLDIGMYVGIALGGLLIILMIIVIHHKLTSKKRHSQQLDFLLKNGGREKILEALGPKVEKLANGGPG